MRITNKIISQNSVTNINNNKVYEDKLNTQLATGSKINRPSDDPVIAIRALRLRTNLEQVNQYYTKNVPDAESWLDVTESAVSTVVDIITNMYSDCTKGSVGFDTTEDRNKILESLKALQNEVYATGDADYAGRYVFSGYRTATSVSFGETTKQTYSITEQIASDKIDELNYVNVDKLDGLTQTNAETLGTTEQDISKQDVHRIRLAYDNCSTDTVPTISYYDTSGNLASMTAQMISVNDTTQDAYLSAESAPDGVVYIPETGELILSDDAYDKLMATKDVNGTDINEGEIRITYEKKEFEKGDVRPEHFFACTSEGINYNEGFLGQYDENNNWVNVPSEKDNDLQYISYDVGFNQSARVNTLASELFSPDISRDIDDLIHSIEDVTAMEENMTTLKGMLEADPTNKDLQSRLDAAEKANTFLNDKMQKMFESSITKMQKHLDRANSALTEVGNRSARVDLVSNRLSKQQTNFKTLSSENEDIDMTEVAVDLASVELAYQAALMATGKISQTTLLNYL